MLTHKHYRFIIILELKFGTKRKNRKLRPVSRTSEIESNHSGYTDRRHVIRTFNGMSHEITYTGPLKNWILKIFCE